MTEPIMPAAAALPVSEIPDGHDGRLRAFCLRESGKLFDLTE
jgi:hypothetical protein